MLYGLGNIQQQTCKYSLGEIKEIVMDSFLYHSLITSMSWKMEWLYFNMDPIYMILIEITLGLSFLKLIVLFSLSFILERHKTVLVLGFF